jgi:hypothetical protein
MRKTDSLRGTRRASVVVEGTANKWKERIQTSEN